MTSSSDGRAARRRALELSVLDGVLHALMLGTSESYLGALAVDLGHRDVALSLLATVPLLAGALAQLASPAIVHRLGNEKRWVVVGATLQALTHAAFFAIAWTGNRSLWLLLAVKIAYWVSGSAIAPAWNAWMTRILPARLRARFFARRFWITHVALLASFLASGFALDAFEARGTPLHGFALLYLVALGARLVGAFVLTRKAAFGVRSEAHAARPRPPLRAVLRAGRFQIALFAAAMLFGAQIAVPFFTPYMLSELGLSLGEFAVLTSISIGAKAIAFPLWRRALPTIGSRRALVASGALIASVPLFWVVFRDFETLAIAQLVGGVAWAGYELTSLELLMGDAPKEGAVEFYAIASSMAGFTQVLGSVLGGVALGHLGLGYDEIFVCSAIGRGLALVMLLPTLPRDLRRVWVESRAVSVRPGAGAVRDPVIPDDEAHEIEDHPA